MAERRMFAKKIIDSARFIKMPVSSQSLYFHLGMRADDDGIVEAFSVMRLVGATEDDLKILVAKGFVVVLNDDLVAYLTDWTEHNQIRSDRKIDSQYKDLLLQVIPDAKVKDSRPRADAKPAKQLAEEASAGRPDDGQGTSNGPHRLGKDRLGKVRLGKVRLGKVSIVEDRLESDISPAPEPYGEFHNVRLDGDQYEKLIARLGERKASQYIERLSEYMSSKGKRYKSHYATILAWWHKDGGIETDQSVPIGEGGPW